MLGIVGHVYSHDDYSHDELLHAITTRVPHLELIISSYYCWLLSAQRSRFNGPAPASRERTVHIFTVPLVIPISTILFLMLNLVLLPTTELLLWIFLLFPIPTFLLPHQISNCKLIRSIISRRLQGLAIRKDNAENTEHESDGVFGTEGQGDEGSEMEEDEDSNRVVVKWLAKQLVKTHVCADHTSDDTLSPLLASMFGKPTYYQRDITLDRSQGFATSR
jgi:hypothetical protein